MRFLSTLFASLLIFIAPMATAQSIIRDSEIEYALKEMARPILSAAGLSTIRMRIIVIQDDSLNAFVVDANHIFIHSGLIRRLDSAEQLQAVIAHEAAHISNGHLGRRSMGLSSARSAAGIGLLLSAIAASAGNSDAATALAIGSNSVATRDFLAHTRGEESAADQSAARYLARAGISPQAMVEVQELFESQQFNVSTRQDPYLRTHPLTSERLRAARSYVELFEVQLIDQTETQYWYDRARGKLDAWLGAPSYTLRRLEGRAATDIVLMQRAVAYLRMPDFDAAIRNAHALVALVPEDPYAHELLGQIHFEAGNFQSAAVSYARAVEILPRDALILTGLGRAYLAQGGASNLREAVEILERAYSIDPRQSRLLRELAFAYAQQGNNGMASLMTAERYALSGNMSDAALHAQRASDQLPRGSVGWNRAQDVLVAANRAN